MHVRIYFSLLIKHIILFIYGDVSLPWSLSSQTAPNGEYVPAVVEHGDDLPCRGLFLLHQGIQRRIRITIVHENSPDLIWRDVRELVVGEFRGGFVYYLVIESQWLYNLPCCDFMIVYRNFVEIHPGIVIVKLVIV